jgi:predicted nucleic acid-binding protein
VIVISNSSPLIALSQIDRLDLLGQLHQQVTIPPAVAREIERTIPRLPDWIAVKPLLLPRSPYVVSSSIGPGEHEVISLGAELRAARLILDERPARRLATSLGLSVIGTVGLLLAAKGRGFLMGRGFLIKIRPELDRLRAVRFFMDEELYDRVLAQAEE